MCVCVCVRVCARVTVCIFTYAGAGCAAVYLFALLHTPTMLHFYGAGFLMWEISSFFVHARWFLFKLGAKKSYQTLNGLGLLLSFTLCRIGEI